MAFLNNSFAERHFDFFSLNEPYSYDNNITNIPKAYKIAAHHTAPKSAIAIKSSFNSQVIHITQEIVVILANIFDMDLLLASIYCPPSNNIDDNLNILRPILNKYTDLPMIILGDFNAKSRVWGQRNLDDRGSKLLSFCNQQDLNIENSPDSLPSFSSIRGESWIDLLITKNLQNEISMEILDEVTNSDHNLIILNYPLHQTSQCNDRKIFLRANNWFSIKSSISQIIDANIDIDQLSTVEINTYISSIQNHIFEANSTFSNSRTNMIDKKKKRSAVWWTSELEVKRSKTRALRRQFQKERNQQIRSHKKLIYKKNLAEYKKLILNTKKRKFKEFINSITNSSLFGKNFNIITNKKKRSTLYKPVFKSDGALSSSIDETTSAILDFHFPWSNVPSPPSIQQNIDDFTPATCQELESLILSIKPNKAPGPDGLPGEIIREIFYANKTWFTELFNTLLQRGFFPTPWKIAKIVLIDKDLKTMDHPSHFRPICLLPCWGKVLDKLISDRLSYHLESEHKLSGNQFGFRKYRSTVAALQNILNFHDEASRSQQMTCLISIDMSNAFNTVDWNILFNKLNSLNLPIYLTSIIQHFLSDRKVQLQGQTKDYNRGIPQGSSLGPILWNVFIDDLLHTDFGPNIMIQAFADDILLMLKAPASYCFTQTSKDALKIVDTWTKDNLMAINHNALQVLAGIPPLDIYLKHTRKLHHIKMGQSAVSFHDLAIQPNTIDFKKPIIQPWTKTSLSWSLFSAKLQGTLIYTDGSKLNSQVGGAFVVFQQNSETCFKKYRLSNSATVFMAELVAIDKAIEYVILHKISPANIITDSRSVLLALSNPNNLDPSITCIKNKVRNYTGQVHLFWIKAHAGHMGNERADELAKEATNSPTIDITIPINLQFIKKLIKKDISAEWQDRWTNSNKGREVFALLPTTNEKRVQGDFFLNQLITGHGTLAVYQNRFFGKTAACECGSPREDRNHLIFDCPQRDSIRSKFFPSNFKRSSIDLLLFNPKSKNGLREIMQRKLQTLLNQIEDEDLQA
ncbi:RNA-directed DNA polymerase from mobile element jockey [Caerostris darwini]|uniref:RNA-directed DNA polymerase from mobile element jockey n=1 Tax=Caerostris darwini TaxID=1538125 RepID=A0AAV4SWX0_9ARAC|nr:RNA-directed DNA polymerase from mobile element jockey [Caerostris darwini]